MEDVAKIWWDSSAIRSLNEPRFSDASDQGIACEKWWPHHQSCQQMRLSDDEAIQVIQKTCKKYGVSYHECVNYLLGSDAIEEIKSGEFPLESLWCHVRVWKEGGCKNMFKTF